MYRITADDFTGKGLTNIVSSSDFSSFWRRYYTNIYKIDPSLIVSGSKDPFVTENIILHSGAVIRHSISVVDSVFNSELLQKYKNSPSTMEKNNNLDFLGFFSKPKISMSGVSDKVIESIFYIIENLNSLERLMVNSLSKNAINTYKESLGEIQIPKNLNSLGSFRDPIQLLCRLLNIKLLKPSNFLFAILTMYNYNINRSLDGYKGLSRLFKITKKFTKDQDLLNYISTEISPYLDNDTDIRKDLNFISESIGEFYTNIRKEYTRLFINTKVDFNFYKNYSEPGSELTYNVLNNLNMDLFMIKYLKFYFEIGYEKLSGNKLVINKDKVDVKTGEAAKKESSVKSPAVLVKSETGTKELQNKAYQAYSILKNNKVADEIPTVYNDGIRGKRTNELLAALKTLIANNNIIKTLDLGEPDSGFGKYEMAAIEYVLANYNKFLNTDQDDVASPGEYSEDDEFLGIEGLKLSSGMQDYIIKDLTATEDNNLLRSKIFDLIQFNLNRNATEDEVKNVMSKIRRPDPIGDGSFDGAKKDNSLA